MLLLVLSRPVAADPFVEWPGPPADGFGLSYGVALADVDGDGWTDLVNPAAGALWLNDGATGWVLVDVPELDDLGSQYAGSLGDYDADGLPDFATEPRGPEVILLHNEGDGDFAALDGDRFPQPPPHLFGLQAETNGWIDADGDGHLDLLVPAYYGSTGFYQSLGPDSGGEYEFDEVAEDVGIVLSASDELRPEGAQFADVDRDGDPDLYACGKMLRNHSTPGATSFDEDDGGIDAGMDEGAAFADVDMDGDLDLGVYYNGILWKAGAPAWAFLLWENLGDATFAVMDPSVVEDYDPALDDGNVGLSFSDWDNDGDPDLTFANHFEQNRWREDKALSFVEIDTSAGQPYALPSWFDWDFDGDLDIALAISNESASLFTNSVYDGVAEGDRQFLRVRPVADSTTVPHGVDTEFGATVEVRVAGEAPEVRRRAFTASGHGYLNQNEYALTFGLEGLADPVVDVSVEFANPGDEGMWRVDRYVNPILGDIDVAALALPREVRVFRSGEVMIDGKSYTATTLEGPLLETPGGLYAARSTDDVSAVDPGTWVGLEIEVPADADPTRGAAIREVVVEGVLGAPVSCDGTTGNVLVWDVTDEPTLVGGTSGAVAPRNRRVDVPADFELQNGHTYRVLALVTHARAFPAAASSSWVTVAGPLEIVPASPCDPASIAAAAIGFGDRSMAVRWRERVVAAGPDDTGDTGETGDTSAPKDDSGTPKDDTGYPPVDSPPQDGGGDGETDGGCGCASGSGAVGSLAFLASLLLVTGRRCRPLSR